MDEKFGKDYKLCSRNAIKAVFEQKISVRQFPFTLFYAPMSLPTDKKFQIVISAPKRIFKKAHDRNRIKRLMREVFRKNKLILEHHLTTKDTQLALFLVYTHPKELDFSDLMDKMKFLLLKLTKEV